MIIWLDGTYGVGKSSVAEEIQKKCSYIENFDSDDYYQKMLKKGFGIGGGVTLQTNEKLLKNLKAEIEKMASAKYAPLIIQMALTDKKCKEILFDELRKKLNIFHIVLTANRDTITSRIESNAGRDKEFAKGKLVSNMEFLSTNFPDAIEISTENRSASDTADEIIAICNLK